MRLTAIALAILLLSACDSADNPDPLMERRLGATLELRIGSIDDPVSALTRVTAMVVGRDERIYTLHMQEQRVRIHDPQGVPAGSFGRKGEGPGEFMAPSAMGWLADTLWVFDGSLSRVSYFDADGGFLRAYAVAAPAMTSTTLNAPRPDGLFPDGTISARPMAWLAEMASGEITELPVWRVDAQGGLLEKVYARSVGNSTWHIQEPSDPGGAAWYGDEPFSDADLVLHAPASPDIVRVRRTAAPAAGRDSFEVSRVTFTGDTLFRREYPYQARSIDRTFVDSIIQEVVDLVSGAPGGDPGPWTPSRAAELARASLYLPPTRPPITDLRIGHDGSIWLQREVTTSTSRDWQILTPEGNVVGTVTLPANLSIMDAELGRVWGVETDELDVPYIVRYGVAPGSDGEP